MLYLLDKKCKFLHGTVRTDTGTDTGTDNDTED